MVVWITRSPNETRACGRALGNLLEPGDLLSLEGDLGSGKTLFAKGVAQALAHDPDDVRSPTFTLIHEHYGQTTLYHLDLYRLENPEVELPELGYEEYLDADEAVTVVEWGDRAGRLRPERRFDVVFTPHEGGRRITVRARGMEKERLDRMRKSLRAQESQEPAPSGDPNRPERPLTRGGEADGDGGTGR